MRGHGLTTVTQALADHECTDQTGDAGVNVHHRSTRKIECALGPQIACVRGHCLERSGIGDCVRTRPVPDHVRNRKVSEREPKDAEQKRGGELDALGKGTNDQDRGDGGKGALKGHENQFRNVDTLTKRRRHRVGSDALQEQFVEGAVEHPVAPKGERVPIDDPEDRDDRKNHHALHQNRQHVFGSH